MAIQTITHSDTEYSPRSISDKQLQYTDINIRAFRMTGANIGATSNTYADGQFIGNIQKLTSVLRESVGATTLKKVVVTDLTKQNSRLELITFEDTPAGTFTDNATLVLTDADAILVQGSVIIPAGAYNSYSANSIATLEGIELPITGASGKDLWIGLISRGAPTYVADELSLQVSFY